MKGNILRTVKRVMAITLSAAMSLQMTCVYATTSEAGNSNENNTPNKIRQYTDEELAELVYSNENTDEVLELLDRGIDTEHFFEGDLVKGITRESIIEWKEEGKDITDVVHERAVERSAPVGYGGTYRAMGEMARASQSGDGKYYLTKVENYFTGCEVDLTGTPYDHALFNPKTASAGASSPWYIDLGNEEAMCCTYGAGASLGTSHNYVQSSINALKNNAYFQGNSSYPLEAYLRGAVYAYETLTYPDKYRTPTGTLNADLQELVRKTNGEMVYRSGKELNYALFQIITWRIAQGNFDANNQTYEKQMAHVVFDQMYTEEYGNAYTDYVESFYEYYCKMAVECASGNYDEKFRGVTVSYWAVQGSNSAGWQDFITWNMLTDVPVKDNFRVYKNGKVMGAYKYPNATFYIYSDNNCTNKIGEFTTDSRGQATISAVEGIYYLKEINAPAGTVLNTTVITMRVYDDTVSADVTNEEYYNGITFRKYDTMGEVITSPGKFALYEYVNGTYLKLCDFSFKETGFTTSSGVKIPDYSYVLSNAAQTYHGSDGKAVKTMTSSNIYYTPVNKGKFKIVEEAAPAGYKINTAGKTFTMNINEQGYLNNFTSALKGIRDEAYNAGAELTKYDTLSAEKLTGAEFKIQEKIGSEWYDVGKLVYDNKNKVYKTSATQTYIFRNSSASICRSVKDTDYPLSRTTANGGKYRIVETVLPNDNYTGFAIKTFSVAPSNDNYMYKFSEYNGGLNSGKSGMFNVGKSVSVKTSKYDEITKEQLTGENIATMTVYEYNNYTDKWQSLGDLVYNNVTDEYILDSNKFYIPHTESGSLSSASVGATYSQGYIYYTSVNNGKFKIVETVNPVNYLLGNYDNSTSGIKAYEKTFTIDEETTNREVIDFTDTANAAYDMGVSSNLEVEKYDVMTGDKVSSGDAEFMVYENVNGNWLEFGELVYNESTKAYISQGMTGTYHKSNGEAVLTTVLTDKTGLTYTSANKGKFKVAEIKAPEHYTNSGFEKEFVINEKVTDNIRYISYSSGAKDIGIRGTVNVEKYDIVTGELAKTFNAEFTVYENVNGNWLESGKLKYNSDKKMYTCDGVEFTFHKADGTVIDTTGIPDYKAGKLYYTTANKGRFKVAETKAPLYYILGNFVKEFTLTTNGQIYDYVRFVNAAQNFGISAILNVQKYDVMTQDVTDIKNTEFTVQEYVTGLNKWLDVAKMKYDEQTGVYSTKGQTVISHNNKGKVMYTNKEGKLYFTTQNLGQYRVIETSAPAYYINGSKQYVREFNIRDKNSSDIIDLTSYANGAKNLGINGMAAVAKFDNITQEKVKTGDTEFTIYEYVNSKWIETGRLNYDSNSHTYVSDGVKFTFHKADGAVINTTDIPDYEEGKLYYTSANKGRFKVAETKPPVHYTIEALLNEQAKTFSEEFVIDGNGKEIKYDTYDSGAKNNGQYAYIELFKYDILTKQHIEFTDAVFMVQEKIGDEWLDVCSLIYNQETGKYESKGTDIILHNSSKETVYSDKSGKLYYTTANEGRYRVIEIKAPTNYVIGSEQYTYEFNVVDSGIDNVIDLTTFVNAPQDLGRFVEIEVAKYDKITKDKVLTGDAEFTVYENVNGNWLESGKLKYNEEKMIYNCDGVNFLFHNEDGTVIETTDIRDYKDGRLYYTTANKGRFKVVETSAPGNYILEDYSVEFNVCNDEKDTIKVNDGIALSTLSFNTVNTNAAQDKGITGNLELLKTDKETAVPLEGAVFALQEWSVINNDWLFIGNLTDAGDGLYTTKDTTFNYHTGIISDSGEEKLEEYAEMVYTTQNTGKFRVVETAAPEGYLNDNYSYEIQLTEGNTFFDLTDADSMATDTPIKVSLSKKSITTGNDITGATLNVKDIEGNVIDSWVSDGTEHIISGIKPGKYIFTEEAAPEGYIISNVVEFEVTETYDIQKVEMFDEEVKGRFIINKTDKATGKKLAGAKFELKAEDDSFSQILVTDENGQAQSDEIRFGIYDKNGKYMGSKKYILTEIAAPSGYDIDRASKTVTFEYKDDKTEIVEVKLDVTNTKTPAVTTGDNLSHAGMTLLLLAVSLAVLSIVSLKKRYGKRV